MKNLNKITGKSQNINIIRCFIIILVLFCSKVNFAADYYWVGGTGNWSEIYHWSTTSGGSVTHLQVPTIFDDVHFDQNSFTDTAQVVTVNAGNYVCRTMDWTGALYNPTFKCLNGYPMSIYGSFILTPIMKYQFNGMLIFESTSVGNQLKTDGHSIKNQIYFNGIGSEWDIMDDLNISGYTINFYYGTLRTNNNNIICGTFSSNSGTIRKLYLGSSIITTNGWNLNSSNLTFDCGTSTINMNNVSPSFSSSGLLVYNNLNINDSTGMANVNSLGGGSTFNNVNIKCNSLIYGTSTFNNLILSGKYYILQAGCTTKIQNSLITNGTCASRVFIQSNGDSIFSSIIKSTGNITLDYVVLKDIHASGGATFTANNSVNMSNNNGWTINGSAPLNIYWVGGSGNWNDPNHWSYTSGGAPGACIPSAYDNVYFDSQSFNGLNQFVNINVVNAFCKSIDWTGSLFNPTFKNQMGCNLYVYGSWTFTANMTNSYSGIVLFMSQSLGNTIKSATKQFNNNVYFEGYHGGWALVDDFSTGNSNIFFDKGTLNTNNNGVICNNFVGTTSFDRTLLLGSSIITVNGAWSLGQTHLTFNSGTSTIILTNISGSINNSATDTLKYYDVSFVNSLGTVSARTNSGVSKYRRMKVNGNGIITGNNVYKSLRLSSKYYVLEVNKTQTILDSLVLNSSCSSNTFIYSSLEGTQAILSKASGNVTIQYAILKDIKAIGGASFIANSSIDFGNNAGWVINVLPNSDLYWVGGSGNWDDPNHWSYTSGGAGGACIPMPTTNVIFDQLSFNGAGQYCNINIIFAFCHNMTWNGVISNPELKGSNATNLRVFGSLYFENNMTNNFNGPVYFEAMHAGHQLLSANKIFSNTVAFIGVGGDWSMLDNFSTLNTLYLVNGKLNAANKIINCGSFQSNYGTYRKLDITSSTVILKSSWGVGGNNFVLNASNSLIKLTTPNTFNSTPSDTLNYFNVMFENPAAMSTLSTSAYPTTFKTVTFKGDGIISGKNIYDTLTFFPSRTYYLAANQTQYVNKQFNCTGNGCFPIKLRSTVEGTQSTMSKASGMVSVGYVDMRDQNATGGAGFYAGNYSTNVSNNTGWVFNVAPGYTYGFPDTLYVCPNDSITIDVEDVFTICQYSVWQDSTISNIYTITEPGKYWVRVVFANNCYYVDTINVVLNSAPFANAGADVTICEGASVNLTASGNPGSTFVWNTNDSTSTINVHPVVTTSYSVVGTSTCGAATDIITVNVNPLPHVVLNAGNDTLVCPGSNFMLTANGSNIGTYHWSTNQNSQSITTSTNSQTVYSVTVSDPNSCGTASDAITVSVQAAPFVTLGNDLPVCAGSNAMLHATGANIHEYIWSTGETSSTIIVSPLTNTTYYVTVTDNLHCNTATDAVILSVSPIPTVNAGSDVAICYGTSTNLYADGLYATGYSWSNGQNTQTTSVAPNSTTVYVVTASNSCGIATDEVTVMINDTLHFSYSVVNEACDKANGMIIAIPNNLYSWSNGATTATVSNLSTGNYIVTITHNNCSATESVFVGNIPGPQADFTVNAHKMTLGDGPFIFTDASQNAVAWFWDFGDGASSSAQNPKHAYNLDGTYKVSLTVVDDNNCSDTKVDEVVVNIYDGFATPNAFTPNGDGLNDAWGPIKLGEDNVIKFELFVYDRWGKLLYETDNVNNLWDGTDGKGKVYSEGVYTYLFNYEISTYDNYKQTGTKIGQVTLLN